MSKEKAGQTPAEGSPDDVYARVDEVRGVETITGKTDWGVGRISVTKLRMPESGPPLTPKGVRTAMDYVREEQALHDELMAVARREVIPTIQFRGDANVCGAFEGVDGNHNHFGVSTWCQGERCPSWNGGKCASGLLTIRSMVSRTVNPASVEEGEKLALQPGASIAADYPIRLKARIDEIKAERAAAKKAAEAAKEAERLRRFQEAREERNRPHFDSVREGENLSMARARVIKERNT